MFKRIFAVVFLIFISTLATYGYSAELKVGDEAPVFQTDKFDLAKLRGKTVVLYFYPKDWTKNCTIEAKDFRNHFQEFQELHTTVVGISNDDEESHLEFKKQNQLPFELISDTSKIAKQYGVKGFFWSKRSTFLINSQGKIEHIWHDVQVENHAQEVLQKIKDLKL
jgi:peroxiredoxin Q/BCP